MQLAFIPGLKQAVFSLSKIRLKVEEALHGKVKTIDKMLVVGLERRQRKCEGAALHLDFKLNTNDCF